MGIFWGIPYIVPPDEEKMIFLTLFDLTISSRFNVDATLDSRSYTGFSVDDCGRVVPMK